jgi:hypothetical protein
LVRTPPPPKPPRERSRLGRVVLSLVCLALGAVFVLDLAGVSVPKAAYPATALAVIGLGLVVGAWLGRARWLIFPGLILTIVVMIISIADHGHLQPWRDGPWHIRAGTQGDVVWAPTSTADLSDRYSVNLGNGTLDLTKVSFGPNDRISVDVTADAGNLVVFLPPNVDVDVMAKVDAGSADVLTQRWSGLGNDSHEVHDDGPDGPGGGHLSLTATVTLGKLEVHR